MSTRPRATRTTSLDAPITIPSTVLSQALEGETVLLNLDTGTYFGLNPLGTRIWQLLSAGHPPRRIVGHLVEEYEVEESKASCDLLALLNQLKEHGLLTDGP